MSTKPTRQKVTFKLTKKQREKISCLMDYEEGGSLMAQVYIDGVIVVKLTPAETLRVNKALNKRKKAVGYHKTLSERIQDKK